MKKQLLTFSIIFGLMSVTFGQDFSQALDNTGFSYNCDLSTSSSYTWDASYFPNCAYTSTGTGSGSLDPILTNELTIGFGQGSAGYAFFIFTLTTPLDLSSVANQKLRFKLRNQDGSGNALPLTYTVHLEGAGSHLTDSIPLNVTGTKQVFDADFSSIIKSGKTLSSVNKIVFIYDACNGNPVEAASKLFISAFQAGSNITTTDVKQSRNIISNSKVYPNPTSNSVTVHLDLKSEASLKIVLNDFVGKPVKTIADGNYITFEETINVSDLSKGSYLLTYIVNGVPAKVESVMVVR